jgi:hypothetical protein
VNFTFDTITPVRELVIVIPDLYQPRELCGASRDDTTFKEIPGLETVARFGARTKLAAGWRSWLLGDIGRLDLEGLAPACIAAAALDPALAASLANSLTPSVTSWIATAVHLHAGLTRVHFDQRGLLRLTPAEQAVLSADFARSFGSSHQTLAALPSGEFLLSTPGLPPLATEEPGRAACGELDQMMPSGAAAAPLRRLLAEIEMWLHALPLNEARRSRGEVPFTALWPWGAAGRIVRPEQRAPSGLPAAFGRDAWLEGLWRLNGAACRAPPEHLGEVLAAGTRAAVLVVEVGGQWRADESSVGSALRRLDERFVSPALQALRRGAVDGVSVMLNDARARIERGSLRKFWRRTLRGLEGFT